MVLQKFEIRNVVTGLFGQNFTNGLERLDIFLFKRFVNQLEGISEVKIVNRGIEVKLNKISGAKTAHAFEEFSLRDIFSESYLEMCLHCLEKVTSIDISELVIPDLGAILIDGSSIDVSPQSESGLSVAEYHIEERYHSVSLSLLLSFLGVLVLRMENAVLNIHSVDILEAAGCDFCLEDSFQPRQTGFFEDGSQVMDVQSIKMDKFGQFLRIGEIGFFVFEGGDKLLNFLLDNRVDLIGSNAFVSISKDLIFKLFVRNQLSSQDFFLTDIFITNRQKVSQSLNKVNPAALRCR